MKKVPKGLRKSKGTKLLHLVTLKQILSEKRIYLNAILLLLKPIRLLHFGQLTRRANHLVLLAVKAIRPDVVHLDFQLGRAQSINQF